MRFVIDIDADYLYKEIEENTHLIDQERYEVLGILHTIAALGLDDVFYPIMMKRFDKTPTVGKFADELYEHSSYILDGVKKTL